MKFSYALVALLGATSAIKVVAPPAAKNATSLAAVKEPCEPALDVSQKQLDIELDYFSRNFDMKHYNNAVTIFNELKKNGSGDPKLHFNTWELYDKSFAWPKVRHYPIVEDHLNQIEHFQDNLNLNPTNMHNVEAFVKAGKEAQSVIGEKYHNGEWTDPATYDPQAEHPKTWANAHV